MTKFVALRAKAYAYLMENGSKHEKVKGTKKCLIKRELMFGNYKDSQFNDKIILKPQQRFKSSNDDKRLQTFDKITTYPYGTNAFKVCESEILSKYK